MCILLWTTACSERGIPLLILSNRDEFLRRPTRPAGPWGIRNQVFGGQDLARPEHGTWLGITRNGRFAALTNVRESDHDSVVGTTSRGAVVSSFLTSEKFISESWMQSQPHHINFNDRPDVQNVGGFSMMCAQLSRDSTGVRVQQMAVTSNRKSILLGLEHTQHTIPLKTSTDTSQGLSNSLFEEPWQKVLHGRRLLECLVEQSKGADMNENDLIREALSILSTDSLSPELGHARLLNPDLLQKSIFIPQLNPSGGIFSNPNQGQNGSTLGKQTITEISSPYGTQKQTVILVHDSGEVRYVERSLYNSQCPSVIPENSIVDIVFKMEPES